MQDLTDKIMSYELGEMDSDEAIDLFQDLVNTGLAWSLQGSYGRTARALLDQGLIEDPHASRVPQRYAFVSGARATIESYLPANYEVRAETESGVVIAGRDNAGWTLDDYVLPRLASGLHFGAELDEDELAEFGLEDE